MAGRAMPTTVESMAAMPEPRTVTATTQRPAVVDRRSPGDVGGEAGGEAGPGPVTPPGGRGRRRPRRDGRGPGSRDRRRPGPVPVAVGCRAPALRNRGPGRRPG